MKLSGRTALVTGGGQGIGRAICEELARQGADIALHEKTASERAKGVAADIERRFAVRCRVLPADFTDIGSIDELFRAFDRVFEQLDIVINNAGFEQSCALEDISLASWDEILRVNLTAPFRVSQQGFARMRGRGGVILNISSIHEDIVRKGATHYSCAKAGLRMLGRSAALEWAEYGVRVVTVSPGPIETEMNRQAIEELGRSNFSTWIPAGRFGATTDVAALVAFLVSDQASFISGTEVYIDGGYMRNLVRYDDRPGRR